MRKLVTTFLLALWAAPATYAQEITPEAAQLIRDFEVKRQRGEEIVAEIGAMAARDVFVRDLIIQGFQQEMSAATRQAFIDGTEHHFDRIDVANTERLKQILEEISWQDLRALSPRAASNALSIISHSNDIAFKRRMMAVFEPLALAGEMDGAHFAMLYDDVAQAEGGLQRYGTNFNCRDGVQQPNPTEDMEHLNERRAALRMEPIETYAARMREMYGSCPAQ